ncbi:MAG: sodium:proton antiporter [Eubacteriales bacterium]|nr:sodium:proton antiporter [Eubacteriales bacterium]
MNIPFWLCIPFIGMLACVALMPVLKADWWEAHQPVVVLGWSVIVVLLYAVRFGGYASLHMTVNCFVNDYLTFIVLLFGLYCASGNISFEGDMAGSPRVNVALLGIGTFLSSLIGTTGASMLMVRPVIKMNSWRRHRSHIMIFFIFMVSNMGGCLTPVGDPPLLMGFMNGVPFTWSFHLLPILLLNMVILLTVFYWIDRKYYLMDVAKGYCPDIRKPGTELKLRGAHNLLFFVMIVFGVILSGVLPGLSAFKDAQGNVRGIPIMKGVTLTYPALIEVAVILLAAWLSFRTTDEKVRRSNHMTWGAIKEVAVLFVGIFLTMQPALELLKSVGPKLGLDKAAQMFWATGFLSSFLDNTPTYLVFSTTAGALGFAKGIHTALGIIPSRMLMAISAGAVFMGAMTYIGNAPNFMVKSLSDENGIRMPSFFGYMKWSVLVLVPLFMLDMAVFFL